MKPWKVLPLLAALLLTACGELSLGIEPAVPTPTAPAQTAEIRPETALPAISPTGASIPQVQPTGAPPAAADMPAPVPTSPATDGPLTVNIYLIALEDQGKSGDPVGCGDSVVPVQVQVPHTQAVLKAALENLLALKQQYYGESGLYNAVYQSDLKVDGITIQDGRAAIQLSGKTQLGGECDNPRFEAQLTKTALQFPTVSQADIYINGRPLKDVISLK